MSDGPVPRGGERLHERAFSPCRDDDDRGNRDHLSGNSSK
jgi:hypothetical protein